MLLFRGWQSKKKKSNCIWHPMPNTYIFIGPQKLKKVPNTSLMYCLVTVVSQVGLVFTENRGAAPLRVFAEEHLNSKLPEGEWLETTGGRTWVA